MTVSLRSCKDCNRPRVGPPWEDWSDGKNMEAEGFGMIVCTAWPSAAAKGVAGTDGGAEGLMLYGKP